MKVLDLIDNQDKRICGIQINEREALSLIQSMSSQLVNKSSNVGRPELYTDKGEYFSIFVTFIESSDI